MVQNPKLDRDDRRRSVQHADVKSELAAEVNRAIASEAQAAPVAENPEVVAVGRELEQRAVREVTESDDEVIRARRAARVAQVIDYVFFVIYALIIIMIVLEAAGARESSGFKGLMDTVTTPFLGPFRGLFSDPAVGEYRFMFSYLAAFVVWLLAHMAIRGLLRLYGHRKTTL